MSYTIKTGDNLWAISERALTDAWGRPPTPVETTSYLAAVIDANRASLPDPSNPALIYPGGTLTIPTVPPNA